MQFFSAACCMTAETDKLQITLEHFKCLKEDMGKVLKILELPAKPVYFADLDFIPKNENFKKKRGRLDMSRNLNSNNLHDLV